MHRYPKKIAGTMTLARPLTLAFLPYTFLLWAYWVRLYMWLDDPSPTFAP